MIRTLGAFIFLGLAAVLPVEQAAAQDVLGGAIVGGALGGIVGGALGRGGGAVAGAVIGATTGAVIAAEARRLFERILLVAGRLLLSLSQRRVAASAAGLLRLLIIDLFRPSRARAVRRRHLFASVALIAKFA